MDWLTVPRSFRTSEPYVSNCRIFVPERSATFHPHEQEVCGRELVADFDSKNSSM
jgi:hypothetical protein